MNPEPSQKISTTLWLSLAFGLSFGFFDVSLQYLVTTSRPEPLTVALLAVAASGLLFAFVHATLVVLLTAVARSRDAAIVYGATAGLAALLAVLLIVYSGAPVPRDFLRIATLGLVALLAAGGGFMLHRTLSQGRWASLWRSIYAALPAISALAFAVTWYKLNQLVLALAVALALAATWRFSTVVARVSTAAMFLAAVAGGLLGLQATFPANDTWENYSENHALPHVILITIDTLRRDALSSYGGETPTPHFDALAADGVSFEDALSAAPWTLPALASIMTGISPASHTAVLNQSVLPKSLTTLAEAMQDAGYHTGAIGSNPYLDRSRCFDQGFAYYQAFPRDRAARSLGVALLSRIRRDYYATEASTARLADLSIQWVERNTGRDFFFWAHYFDPHGPWEPPPAFRPSIKPPAGMTYRFQGVKEARAGMKAAQPDQRDWLKFLYDGEVRYVDAEVGRFIDALKRLGVYDDAMIIVTSDHGEEFWEHGNLGHGQHLYNELLGVPLIVKLPASSRTGRIETTVATQAIMATVLDYCGIAYDNPDPNISSLRPLLEDGAFEERPVFSGAVAFYEDSEAVTFDDNKYIRKIHSLQEELYDLRQDPGEHDNLLEAEPQRAEAARMLLDEHDALSAELREFFRVLQTENLKLDAETERRLKALGYL